MWYPIRNIPILGPLAGNTTSESSEGGRSRGAFWDQVTLDEAKFVEMEEKADHWD